MTVQNESDKEFVTDKEILQEIIRRMEDGVMPWRRPWSDSAEAVIVGSEIHDRAMWPSNLRAPKIPYGVFNGTILLARASQCNYRTNLWIASEVASGLGARIVDDDNRPTAIQRYRKYEAGVRLVYNIDQIVDCETSLGLALIAKRRTDAANIQFEQSKKRLDRLRSEHSIQIVKDNRAAYAPSWDVVMIPDNDRFETEASYWATLWHEIVHWTGHDTRLNRDRHARWGDKDYAFEELVAELGAAFLCAHFGINGELQHESYLDSWCRALKEDRVSSLWAASTRATEAKDFLLASTKGLPR